MSSTSLPVPRGDNLPERWAAGEKLAAEVAQRLPPGHGGVEDIIKSSLSYLSDAGIVAEIVRVRSGCLVLKARAEGDENADDSWRLLAGWLDAIPRLVGGSDGAVVETRQLTDNGPARVFTTLWVPGAGGDQTISSDTHEGPNTPVTDVHLRSDVRVADVAPVRQPRSEPASQPAQVQSRSRRQPGNGSGDWSSRTAWIRRRGWMLVLGLLAGLIGGIAVAATHHVSTYSATTRLEVRSGASAAGPGSENDADSLAITYAALLPNDQAVLTQVATDLNSTPADVSSNLSATADSGTAIVEVRYTSATAGAAVRGADAIADVVSGTSASDEAISSGSVAVVSRSANATASNSSALYGVILGAFLGLLVGAGLMFVAERSDRRIDDVESLGDATGASATRWPDGLSPFELACAVQGASESHGPVTVIPMRAAQAGAARDVATQLEDIWWAEADRSPQTSEPPEVKVNAAPDSTAWEPAVRGTDVVLVVGPGERCRAVSELVDRLALLSARPAWSVLATGDSGGASHVSAG